MLGSRVDLLIHELNEETLTHFLYQSLRKQFGFVINKRHEYIVVEALLKARNIPNANVTLFIEDKALAIVRSCNKPHMVYKSSILYPNGFPTLVRMLSGDIFASTN